MRELNRFKGCLVGGAVGDALGYPVEFMPAAAIFQKYGRGGIREYALRRGVAEISDDTQMTLFTATGLLLGSTRGMTRGIMGGYEDYIMSSYLDWYRTQTERYPLPKGHHFSWLVNVPGLFSLRAPGNTCMSALAAGGNGTLDAPLNHSRGCGGVMRAAPIGLYFNDRPCTQEEIDRIGAKAAVLTHGHELGYLPAAMLAHIISRIAGHGDTVPAAVRDAMAAMPAVFPRARHLDQLLALIGEAADLAGSDTDDLTAIRRLGEGWVGDEALAIAVYCAMRYADDFEKGVVAAVNHDGDSDSTGSLTGNILGAALGYGAIPQKYLDKLELRDVIEEVAEDLWKDCQVDDEDRCDPVWESKYIAMTYRPEGRADV